MYRLWWHFEGRFDQVSTALMWFAWFSCTSIVHVLCSEFSLICHRFIGQTFNLSQFPSTNIYPVDQPYSYNPPYSLKMNCGGLTSILCTCYVYGVSTTYVSTYVSKFTFLFKMCQRVISCPETCRVILVKWISLPSCCHDTYISLPQTLKSSLRDILFLLRFEVMTQHKLMKWIPIKLLYWFPDSLVIFCWIATPNSEMKWVVMLHTSIFIDISNVLRIYLD